ncbi:tyrosine-type recombinase/integrase [Thiothrix subterranea]|uniref:Integrase arm-type DNA-binding domain-containing protein n=1 Tax=Thiothrix subterranea TaxID=2735563 RepID=A0AA51MRH8_9GAMM|nr:integrase arm-type DNA-binding domain-containing protein [Thiothrix subterranea]MDQ5769554.1 integrase arm-type DNA-binding domain-containing protein [Thiothrix subterranea]WML87137.1 integrase arm-type DNA-binding domain-containing protein [Thiothrix subterranea]
MTANLDAKPCKRKLTDSLVKVTKPHKDGKPRNYSDGGGLYLHVTTNGKTTGRVWRYNYRLPKQKTLTIGSYPDVSLKLARERHEEARALLARGIDPSVYKRELQANQADADSNSFEAVAREWFVNHLAHKSQTHQTRTVSYMERDVFPYIGKRPIAELKPRELITVIERIQKRITHDTHLKVLGSIGQICRYAVATGRAETDPTPSLRGLFKPGEEERQMPAITDPIEVGRLLRAIDNYHGNFYTVCALKLSALVMLRPGELIEAEWSEIHLDNQTWEIEVRRMKAPTRIKQANNPKNKHIIPLSAQALAIFEELRPLSGHKKYVFQGMPNNRDNPMNRSTVNVALKRMGFHGQMTAHGFRGMASSLLNSMYVEGRKRWDESLVEQQLGHKEKNAIKAAYDRADCPVYVDVRRDMMQVWADYLDQLRAGGQVIPFQTKGK